MCGCISQRAYNTVYADCHRSRERHHSLVSTCEYKLTTPSVYKKKIVFLDSKFIYKKLYFSLFNTTISLSLLIYLFLFSVQSLFFYPFLNPMPNI
jgi:hypothetical protein